jgi:hypothetical protein
MPVTIALTRRGHRSDKICNRKQQPWQQQRHAERASACPCATAGRAQVPSSAFQPLGAVAFLSGGKLLLDGVEIASTEMAAVSTVR